jgi:hypothetical protein
VFGAQQLFERRLAKMGHARTLRHAAHIGQQFDPKVLEQFGEMLEVQDRVTDRKKRLQAAGIGWARVLKLHPDTSSQRILAKTGCVGTQFPVTERSPCIPCPTTGTVP